MRDNIQSLHEGIGVDVIHGVITRHVVSIPKIGVELPVYLGATSDNLAAGAAVLGQTSLPTGGTNTNCVIAGHRGWRGADYFRHLDKLEVGDSVTVTNLWNTLEYRVSAA